MFFRAISLAVSLPVLAVACAAPTPEPASTLPYSSRLLGRMDSSPISVSDRTPAASGSSTDSATTEAPSSAPVHLLPAATAGDAHRGLISLSPERRTTMDRAAADPVALEKLLQTEISPDDLAALVALRSPSVRAAWSQYEAARTSYQQSKDLEDLVGMYQAFTASTMTRVGPNRSNKPTAMVAPSPNVNALSAEVAKRTTEIAFQAIRAAVRDGVARAWEVHADAARLAEARRILREELVLDRVLLDIQRAHLESGDGSQAGFLAFESRVARLTTELSILDQRVAVVRAQWNALLSREENAPIELNIESSRAIWSPSLAIESAVFQAAVDARPELRSAKLATERSAVALRLAETMWLPRFDVGSSRLEPGRGFAEPGRMMPPRADFGVHEAQTQEMRARAEAMAAAEVALTDRVQVEIRAALFAAQSAEERMAVHEESVVPLARDSVDAAIGAYEGNRASYLDLLAAAQRLLDARLGLADAKLDLSHAYAGLIRAVGIAPNNNLETNP